MSSEWRTVPIESLCLGIYDGPHATPKKTQSGPIFLGISSLNNGQLDLSATEHLSEVDFLKWTRRVTPTAGDIVFSYETRLGQVAAIPTGLRCCLGRRMALMRVDPEKVTSDYLLYAYLSPGFQEVIRQRTIHGSTVDRIPLVEFGSFPIAVPSLQIQKDVVSVLRALDDRITLLRETNATLESIAQALFKSWFIDFDPVRSKMEGRAPEGMDEATAALFPDSFEESELGLVPKGWQVKAVGDQVNVTDYVANGSFAALKENVTLLDVPAYALYVRTTDYNSGFSGGFRYVDKSAYDFLSKSSLDGSEVIISNVGDVGTVFRPPKWLGLPMTLGSNAVALKSPGMSAYLYFHFSGPLGQHDIQSIITGSAQLKFNKTNFRALRLLVPDSECLARFEESAFVLLSKIETNLAQAKTLINLRETLLPRLISGKLRLPDVCR